MGLEWSFHDILCSNGSPVGFSWDFHGSPLALPWDFRWGSHGLVVLSWGSHASPISFTWVSHGSPMGLPWTYSVDLWICHGTGIRLPHVGVPEFTVGMP